ncbi:MAG TPA: hypothetical protein VK549_09375, partial [Acidimicrobiia bacterium]|nr:hypothetical protein [Acidimicrobiia bacterium]
DQAPLIDRPPSEYFDGRCFVSCEPDERTVPYVLSATGDVVCYASDYCHWDCAFPDTVRIIHDRDDLDHEQKIGVLARNAARLYGIPIPAAV